MIVSVGIDVAKDKHDCFIQSSEGEVLADVFTIPNNMDGFNILLEKICSSTRPQDKIKVGLEATGHYSYNLLGFLLDNGLATFLKVDLVVVVVLDSSFGIKFLDPGENCIQFGIFPRRKEIVCQNFAYWMPHRVRIAQINRAYSLSVMTPCSSSRFVQYWNFRYFTMAIFSGCFMKILLSFQVENTVSQLMS